MTIIDLDEIKDLSQSNKVVTSPESNGNGYTIDYHVNERVAVEKSY